MKFPAAGPGDTGATGTALDYASPRSRGGRVPAGAGAVPVGKPLSIPWLMFVAPFCGTMLLPTLGGRRVLTRHEVFAAEPAREMLHGGSAINWVIPHFAGIPRTVKPPTMGWLIAASMALFHSEAEWVVRLPSGMSAILMALLIADLAARWSGLRVGLIAGLMQATFVYVLMQGRLAEADMPMAAAVCLAMYAFARGWCCQQLPFPRPVWVPWASVFAWPSRRSQIRLRTGKRVRLPMAPIRQVLMVA